MSHSRRCPSKRLRGHGTLNAMILRRHVGSYAPLSVKTPAGTWDSEWRPDMSHTRCCPSNRLRGHWTLNAMIPRRHVRS